MAVATEPRPAQDQPSPPVPGATRAEGAIAGIVAAGAALGVSELVCGLGAGQATLITSVGTHFIDRFAGSLKDLAVSLFGTNDKVALITGIVVLSFLFGALLGIASVHRRWIGAAGFVAFGAIGLVAYLD